MRLFHRICLGVLLLSTYSRFSSCFIHNALEASEGIRKSPRGDNATEPTLGPSGRQERLNCWAKKRQQKVRSHL